MYRRAPPHLMIVPRGITGWFQLSVWLALLAAHVFWFNQHLAGLGRGDSMGPGLFLFCMGLLGWMACCFWWITAHAEVLDYVVLQRELKRKRQKKERESAGEA